MATTTAMTNTVIVERTPDPGLPVSVDEYAAAYERLIAALRSDPLRIHRQHFADDEALVRSYGWAIPNAAAIARIANYAPLVEVGAGVGLWARLLTQAGADVFATDRHPPRHCWYPVLRAAGSRVSAQHPDCTLLLIWPDDCNSMASCTLRTYSGDKIIVVGENRGVPALLGQGRAPATGDSVFHAMLARDWQVIETVEIPQRLMYHDEVVVYQRRRSGS